MSDEPDPTPEERFQAALDRMSEVVAKWMTDGWEAVQPFLKAVEKFASDPEVQARLRRRAQEDGAFVAPACRCQCAAVHPDAQVCDARAVTAVRQYSDRTRPINIPVCAPCAAEAMAQPQ